MTSMLSFAWRQHDKRRSHIAPCANKDDQSQLTSSPVPDVTTSASGETTVSHCHEHDEESTTTMPCFEPTPSTPEGLRPRKSPNQIREELGLPPHVLDRVHWLPPCFPMPTTTLPTQTELTMSHSTYHASSVMSPQVSNSSFYSRSSYSQSRIAESPNLQIGHAKTAVGAVITMGQAKHHRQEVSMLPTRQSSIPSMASMSHQPQGSFSCMDVLPPRAWFEDEEGDDYDVGDEDSTSNIVDLPYQALHETTPIRRKRKSSVQNQSPESASTMTTVTSSNHASPSSNYNWRRSTQNKGVNVSFSSQIELIADRQNIKPSSYNFDSILAEHHAVTGIVVESDQASNVSAMSQSTKDHDEGDDAAQTSAVSGPDSENFYYQYANGGENVLERALRRRKSRHNRQAKEQLLLAVVERLQDDYQLVADLQVAHNKPADQMSEWLVPTDWNAEGLLTGLEPSKRNEIARQLDCILNEMRVAQPEDFFMSPSQIQGFAQTHNDLQQAMMFVRTLVMRAVPEMEKENAGSALACRFQGRRWKCRAGFRSALGIDEIPQSPETVRGGDTSVFSLPSDDNTPHTSNVSLTTTISSYTSPFRESRNSFQNIRPTLDSVTSLVHKLSRACLDLTDSSKTIRATDQLKRTYLKMMAMQGPEIRALLDAFELEYTPPLRIARQVSEDEEPIIARADNQRRMLQPITTKPARAHYATTFAPPTLHRSMILPPMPPMALLPRSVSNNDRPEPQMIPSKPSEINHPDDSSMSLPRTEDMTSLPSGSNGNHGNQAQLGGATLLGEGMVWLVPSDDKNESDVPEPEYDDVDDLRRQVGSNDYDDADQLREGPEGEEYGCDVIGNDDEERCAA